MQNAIKVYSQFPDSIMDIVKSTDPSTVTQHGLYMRPLGHTPILPSPTNHPPSAPQTPPQAGNQSQSSSKTPRPPQTPADPAPQSGFHAKPESTADSSTAPSATSNSRLQSSSSFTSPQLAVNLESPTPAISDSDQTQGPDNTAKRQLNPSDRNTNLQNPNEGIRKGMDCEGGNEGGWGRGRVTLLGDSAHATIPNGQLLSSSSSSSSLKAALVLYHAPVSCLL